MSKSIATLKTFTSSAAKRGCSAAHGDRWRAKTCANLCGRPKWKKSSYCQKCAREKRIARLNVPSGYGQGRTKRKDNITALDTLPGDEMTRCPRCHAEVVRRLLWPSSRGGHVCDPNSILKYWSEEQC